VVAKEEVDEEKVIATEKEITVEKEDVDDKSDEEKEEKSSRKSKDKDYLKPLKSMLEMRPTSFRQVFEEMHSEVKRVHEEETKYQRRREERFIDLLEEYFYRSDHIGVAWDDAKRALDRHSAYDDLGKSDRKRIYAAYMEELENKMEAKTKSLRNLAEAKAIKEREREKEREYEMERDKDLAGDMIIHYICRSFMSF
jgi:hypothetical protein